MHTSSIQSCICFTFRDLATPVSCSRDTSGHRSPKGIVSDGEANEAVEEDDIPRPIGDKLPAIQLAISSIRASLRDLTKKSKERVAHRAILAYTGAARPAQFKYSRKDVKKSDQAKTRKRRQLCGY